MMEVEAVVGQDPEHSPLIHLPDELWVLILKKVPQNDALKLRLVSKDFKDMVNNLYEDWVIRLILSDYCPCIELILDLRVKEVTAFCFSIQPSFRPPGILFKFPHLIQKLTINSTSTQNANILLQSKNLKSISLELCNDSKLSAHLDPLIGYSYPDLHTLNLTIKIHEGKYVDEPWNIVQRIMLYSPMPKLTSFHIICEHQVDDFSFLLLAFLSQKGQNLKRFIYEDKGGISYSYSGFPPSIFNNLVVLNNMTSLEVLKLNPGFDTLTGTWRLLIKNQMNLRDIDLDCGIAISTTLLRDIAANNFQTLTSVNIKSYGYEGETHDGVLDASSFQACHSLVTLEVDSNHENDMDVLYERHEMINLFLLPTQLKTLDLLSFEFNSGDVLDFLVSHPVLSDFRIRSGVNLPVLQAILAHGALLNVYVMDGMEEPTGTTEIARVNEIYDELGLDGEFDLENSLYMKRECVTANWRGA